MEIKILTDVQEAFLKKAGENKHIRQNFYLTGGTALTAFYLHHHKDTWCAALGHSKMPNAIQLQARFFKIVLLLI